ncbi:colicin transporter [Bifidobacterium saguini]|nr:colicin transporter [Bifidobacterium saguini]
MPPVIPPEPETGSTESSGGKKPKWLIPAIAAGCAVVLAGAGFVGYRAWSDHELDIAKAACATASEKVRESANEYNMLLNGDAADMSAVKANQVKDAKTVDALAKELKATTPEYSGCVADDAKGLDAAADVLDSQAEWYGSHTKSLSKAVKAVNESRAAKTLETAKSNLSSKLEEASQLLSDSDGKVADNATRDNLSKAIDAGNGLKGGNDPARIDEARKSIEDAMKAVNDSVQAKADADAQAAAEAAAAQAAQQAQASRSSSSSSSRYSYSGTSSNRYSGSSSSSSGSSGSIGGFPDADPNYHGSAQGCGNSCTGYVGACDPVTGRCGIG